MDDWVKRRWLEERLGQEVTAALVSLIDERIAALSITPASDTDRQWFVTIDKVQGRGQTIEEAIGNALERFHGCAFRLTGIRPKYRDHTHVVQVEAPHE